MTGEFLIDGVNFKEMMDESDRAKAALAAEQREHDITRRQRDTLQTQCEDMQKELKEAQTHIALDVAFMDANDECIKELNDELETERRLNNATLKPSAKVLQQNQDDEMACMAEEVDGLKYRLTIATEYGNTLLNETKELNQKIEALELVEVALRTEVSKLAGYKVELESSAETQATHMQQVDAACKAAEAKVIEQRNEIEALKSGEDLWICPSANTCPSMSTCDHLRPHAKYAGSCDEGCSLSIGKCVQVKSCKECDTLQEEIINRDAVILEQESIAEDREEIINALAKEIKMMLQGDIVATGSGGGQSRCGDEPTLTLGEFKIAFSGKREGMVKQGVHTRLLRNGDIVTVNPVMTIREV